MTTLSARLMWISWEVCYLLLEKRWRWDERAACFHLMRRPSRFGSCDLRDACLTVYEVSEILEQMECVSVY